MGHDSAVMYVLNYIPASFSHFIKPIFPARALFEEKYDTRANLLYSGVNLRECKAGWNCEISNRNDGKKTATNGIIFSLNYPERIIGDSYDTLFRAKMASQFCGSIELHGYNTWPFFSTPQTIFQLLNGKRGLVKVTNGRRAFPFVL